jgi:hypothetical protein
MARNFSEGADVTAACTNILALISINNGPSSWVTPHDPALLIDLSAKWTTATGRTSLWTLCATWIWAGVYETELVFFVQRFAPRVMRPPGSP